MGGGGGEDHWAKKEDRPLGPKKKGNGVDKRDKVVRYMAFRNGGLRPAVDRNRLL